MSPRFVALGGVMSAAFVSLSPPAQAQASTPGGGLGVPGVVIGTSPETPGRTTAPTLNGYSLAPAGGVSGDSYGLGATEANGGMPWASPASSPIGDTSPTGVTPGGINPEMPPYGTGFVQRAPNSPESFLGLPLGGRPFPGTPGSIGIGNGTGNLAH